MQPASSERHPLIWVAAGEHEAALWEAHTGSPREVVRVLQSSSPEQPPPAVDSCPAALQSPTPLGAAGALQGDTKAGECTRLRTEELSEPPQRVAGMRALLPLAGSTLLTGGSDCAVRLWEPTRPQRCEIVCAPAPAGATAPPQHYDVRTFKGVHMVQEVHEQGSHARPGSTYSPAQYAANLRSAATGAGALGAAANASMGGVGRMDAHRDTITDMAIIEGTQRLLVTCSRDGSIKGWR
ncbi:hypothetical protein CYMTET_29463 [Cymbomonas tetramitiformis]|uniref:Uncharacterized protein n=1 Tax=Cymbomonas tetramitiformis TaxID=36881 RepID=A0AAE0FKQ3_9CHLO|nr:hypothetical protein CYMTET_29463 [Cymbomonas tetramitiformis]